VSERPIVACYRGLDSIDAVQLGARLAATLHEPLVLASAYRYDPAGLSARAMPDADNERRAVAAQTALRRAYAVIPPDVDVRERIVPSTGIHDALIELARDVDACALVLGRDTQGHVTRSLVPRAPCPVAVAPLSVPLPQDHGLECIGVAVDGSRTASWALVAAARLAQEAAARLVLLAAGPTMARAQTLLQAARLSLDREPESLELRALVGDAPATLAQAGGDLDLLVCGSRGLRRPLAAILGSVSSHLVGHAPCPVLVVPPTVAPSPSAPLGLASARAPSGA
jgi:nucleotide-binding universal stress UspA family protein